MRPAPRQAERIHPVATEPIVLPQAPAANPVSLEIVPAPTKKRRPMLPVLIVLFLITYGLVLSLVVFQGSTINSQRLLILDLFRDSSQFQALQLKESQKKRAAAAEKNKGQAQQKEQEKARAAKPKHRLHEPPPPQFPDGPDVSDARRTQVSI
jgi:hypothetical protein